MSDPIIDDKKEKRKNLLIRVLSGAVLTVIALATIIPGSWPLLVFNALISFIGMYELMRVVNAQRTVLFGASVIGIGAEYALIFLDKKEYMVPLFMLYLILLFAFMVIFYPRFNTDQVFMAFVGVIYAGLGLSYLYQTRMQTANGAFIVWLIFICSWISDSGAYLVGIAIGKHKAFPRLSPKKSVEGCIGGIASSILIGVAYKTVLEQGFDIHLINYPGLIVICGVGAIISQAGDLAASAIKRNFNIKDYGHLIPGHGGIMDRFDSLIFVAPLVYYLANLFI